MTDIMPDLPGYVHGIKSVDPPIIQCDGCGLVDEGEPGDRIGFHIVMSEIKFNPRGRARVRMCKACWSKEDA